MNKKFFLVFLFGFNFIFSLNIKDKFKIFLNKGMSFFSNKLIRNEKILTQIQVKKNFNMNRAFIIDTNVINGRKISYYRNNINNDILNNNNNIQNNKNFKEKLNIKLAENYKKNYIKKHKRVAISDVQKAINGDIAREIFTKYRVLED